MDYEKLDIYPLTVVVDRYNGAYSGGKWTAWNMYPECVPYGPFGDDLSCDEFWWDEHPFPIGVGNTPDEAIRDLQEKMESR